MTTRVSNDQLDKLLDFLAKHPSMVRGAKPGVRKETIDKMWADLAIKLNSDRSGSCKSSERWKKYWADIKHKSKTRIMKRKRHASCGGDLPHSDDDILELDKKIMEIVGRAGFGDDQHSFREIDLIQPPTTPNHDADVIICDDVYTSIETSASPSTQGQIFKPCDDVFVETSASPSTQGHINQSCDDVFVETLTTPSSKGHISKTCIIKTEVEADEDVSGTGVESPVSLSQERSYPRTRCRDTTDSNNSQSQVSPEWLLELESSRVESEKKLADAALIMAEASRTQAIALKTLVDLVQKQSEDTSVLLQLLQEQKTE